MSPNDWDAGGGPFPDEEASSAAKPPLWEAVIKVNVHDPEPCRARDIADGIGYAVCLLQDEYGWLATDIENAVQPHLDDAYDREEQRKETVTELASAPHNKETTRTEEP